MHWGLAACCMCTDISNGLPEVSKGGQWLWRHFVGHRSFRWKETVIRLNRMCVVCELDIWEKQLWRANLTKTTAPSLHSLSWDTLVSEHCSLKFIPISICWHQRALFLSEGSSAQPCLCHPPGSEMSVEGIFIPEPSGDSICFNYFRNPSYQWD